MLWLEEPTSRRLVLPELQPVPESRTSIVERLGGSLRPSLLAGICALAPLVIADLIWPVEVNLSGTYLLAPLVAALIGNVPATLIVGLLAVAANFASGFWNGNLGTGNFDLRLAVVVAGSAFAVAGAMARARAIGGLQRLRTLNSVGGIADGSLGLSETFERLMEIVVPVVADLCMIDVFAEDRATRVAVRGSGQDKDAIEAEIFARKPSVPDWLISPRVPAQQRQPLFLSRIKDSDLRDLSHDPEGLEFLRTLGVRSAIIVPMIARGQSLGSLTTIVTGASGRRYNAADLLFVRTLAGRVALALDNAGLFSDLESIERRMDTVMEILGEAVVVHDLGGELIYANRAAAELIGFDSPDELIATKTADISSRFEIRDEGGRPIEADVLGSRRALRGESSGPTVIRAVDRETGEEIWCQTTAKPIIGTAGRPLFSVTTIEDLTAVKRAEFSQRILAQTGQLLASSHDYRETLSQVARMVVPQFADWCSVSLPGENGLIGQVEVAAEVLHSGESQLIDDAASLIKAAEIDPEHKLLLESGAVGSAILVPIRAADAVLGVLSLVNERGSRRFSESDRTLAEEIGRRAGLAVAAARISTERAEIAETLQRELLPPELPTLPGWEFAAMYRPAGLAAQVGGDFYDAIETRGGLVLAIGDVAGHGAEAASVTALARYTIRAALSLTGDLQIALRELNDALQDRSEVSPCSVVLVGIPRDPALSTIRLVVAGHPLPLLIRASGEVVEAGAPGSLVGAFAGGAWEVHEEELEVGDQLLLYTDGVTEARGQVDRYGDHRLRRGVSGFARPSDLVAQIEQALDGFLAGPQEDDAAVLALMRCETHAPLASTATGAPHDATDEPS